MKITELMEQLARILGDWGNLEVQIDDGREIRDDVTLKVYADHADPPPKLMVISPESIAREK